MTANETVAKTMMPTMQLRFVDKDVAAADRIEQLVIEIDETHDEAMAAIEMWGAALKGQREAEAKLAKAVEGLKFYAEKDDYEKQVIVRAGGELTYTEEPIILDDKGNLARKVLAELEKTE